ncbi:unnamed protein product [Meloidogyne enterolobii]|uniref:Uncharacterized protein n=2 Tax=Meloidogyne enterolobii TaxID=390850 RepID=A0A6V7XDK6_MELEN|nr:unnamed protein product [Meloidogyne enterolobii]
MKANFSNIIICVYPKRGGNLFKRTFKNIKNKFGNGKKKIKVYFRMEGPLVCRNKFREVKLARSWG